LPDSSVVDIPNPSPNTLVKHGQNQPRSLVGNAFASFIISQIIAIGGYYSNTELSYVLAFTFFIVLMFVRPRGLFAR
jgi:hypothetical protein